MTSKGRVACNRKENPVYTDEAVGSTAVAAAVPASARKADLRCKPRRVGPLDNYSRRSRSHKRVAASDTTVGYSTDCTDTVGTNAVHNCLNDVGPNTVGWKSVV